VNAINDKSRPNLTTNIQDSSGYAGGAAQIPYVNTINGKSRPNLTTNIQDSSGHAKGADLIQLADAINDRSHSTILLVMPEELPKFHRQTQLMTCLVPTRPRTIMIHQVTPDALPKFRM
jgi:hypothetical protein